MSIENPLRSELYKWVFRFGLEVGAHDQRRVPEVILIFMDQGLDPQFEIQDAKRRTLSLKSDEVRPYAALEKVYSVTRLVLSVLMENTTILDAVGYPLQDGLCSKQHPGLICTGSMETIERELSDQASQM